MNKAFLPAAIAATLLLTACGGESNNSSNTNPNNQSPGTEQVQGKSLVMNIDLAQLQSSGLTADKVVVTISKGEFTKTLEISHENYAATAEFSDLVVGDYQIAVEVYDGETLVAEGEANATVTANQVVTTDLRLELKSGGLVVEVCVPDKTLETVVNNTAGFQVNKTVGLFLPTLVSLPGAPVGDLEDYAYDSDLAYSKLNENDELSMVTSIDQQWEVIDDVKYSVSANNLLEVDSGIGNVFSLNGCHSTVEMHYIGQDNSPAAQRIELKFPVAVKGMDQILYIGDGVVTSSDEEFISPRDISEIALTIHFESTSAEVLPDTYSSVFDSGDISPLFDESLFSQKLSIGITAAEGLLWRNGPDLSGIQAFGVTKLEANLVSN